jgi:hypothetical protein
MSQFDAYEKELLALINKSNSYEPVEDLDEEIVLAKQAAENYLNQTTKINLEAKH